MGQRERNRRRKTRDIIEAAMQVVLDEGLEALTTHRVAKELDVAVGGLYRYFPSKDALIAALEKRVIEELAEDLTEALGQADDVIGDRDDAAAALAPLVVAARRYDRFAVKAPSRFGLISQVMANPRILVPGDEGRGVVTAMIGLLAPIVKRFDVAANAGALEPGEGTRRALMLWSALRGVAQMHKLMHHAPALDVPRLVRETTATLLRGWGASAEDVAAAEALADAAAAHTADIEDAA